MLSRRGFLEAILGTAAAALVVPRIEAIANAGGFPTAAAAEHAAWQDTYMEVLKAANEMFVSKLAEHGVQVRPEDVYRGDRNGIGIRTPDDVLLTTIRAVSFNGDDLSRPECHERVVVPAITALAVNAVSAGIDRYAALPMPKGVEFSGNAGALNMIIAFDVLSTQTLARFSVLGGSSPDGPRIAARYNAQRTKIAIRRRLGTYRTLPLPA